MVLAEQLAGEGRAVPPAYQAVYATVVRPGTSRQICAELAGAHQFRQRQTSGLEFWRWGQSYLEQDEALDMTIRMKIATSNTGWTRYSSEVCSPLMRGRALDYPFISRKP